MLVSHEGIRIHCSTGRAKSRIVCTSILIVWNIMHIPILVTLSIEFVNRIMFRSSSLLIRKIKEIIRKGIITSALIIGNL